MMTSQRLNFRRTARVVLCGAAIAATVDIAAAPDARAQSHTSQSHTSQSPTSQSRTSQPHALTLDAAIERALRENPDVLIAGSAVDSARAERSIAHAYPNPVLAGLPNTPYQYSVTLPVDVTPQRFARERTATLGVAAAGLDRRDVERQTTLAVARAFYDALLAGEHARLVAERRDIIAQLLCADSARFHAGDVAERNLVRSEVELVRADAEVDRARADANAARIALETLIGMTQPDSSLTLEGSLAYRRLNLPHDSLEAMARARRPDLAASEQRIEQAESARHTAAALLLPTPQLSYVRQYTGAFDSGHYYSFGLSFELPSLNRYDGERARAAAAADETRLAERKTRAQLERDVIGASTDFAVQRALVERYESGLIAKVSESVSATRYAYDRGAASLLEVLDAVQTEQDVRMEYMTALHDYWVSVFAVNAAVGADVFGVMQ